MTEVSHQSEDKKNMKRMIITLSMVLAFALIIGIFLPENTVTAQTAATGKYALLSE
ncbi:MAG: hypothetical protein GXP00_12295 [Alphaproteobacteria bacterium]|nr:hypothetical protein [Alphaproteobacteria bacterium]